MKKKCVPLKFWNCPVSVLQVGGWPNYSDQGADTLESNQLVLYWVILVASESTVCVASLSLAVHWGNNNKQEWWPIGLKQGKDKSRICF